MRKGRGGILSILFSLVAIGFLYAVLRQFNYDFVAAGQWVINQIMQIIGKIADVFTKNDWFKSTFS